MNEKLFAVLQKIQEEGRLTIYEVNNPEEYGAWYEDYIKSKRKNGDTKSPLTKEEIKTVEERVKSLSARIWTNNKTDDGKLQYTIFVNNKIDNPNRSIIHELGHAIDYELNGYKYVNDKGTLRSEAEAWMNAKKLTGDKISNDEITPFMDNYRIAENLKRMLGNDYTKTKSMKEIGKAIRYLENNPSQQEPKIRDFEKAFEFSKKSKSTRQEYYNYAYDKATEKSKKPKDISLRDAINYDYYNLKRMEKVNLSQLKQKDFKEMEKSLEKLEKSPFLEQRHKNRAKELRKDIDRIINKTIEKMFNGANHKIISFRKKEHEGFINPNSRYNKQIHWERNGDMFTAYTKDAVFSERFLKQQRSYAKTLGFDFKNVSKDNASVTYNGQNISANMNDFLSKMSILDSMYEALTDEDKVGKIVASMGRHKDIYGSDYEKELSKIVSTDEYRKAWLMSQMYFSGDLKSYEIVLDAHKEAGLNDAYNNVKRSQLRKMGIESEKHGGVPLATHLRIQSEEFDNATYESIANETRKKNITSEDLKNYHSERTKTAKLRKAKEHKDLTTQHIASAPMLNQNKFIGSYINKGFKSYGQWSEQVSQRSGKLTRVDARNEDMKRMSVLNYLSSKKDVSYMATSDHEGKELRSVIDFEYLEDGKDTSVPRQSDLILDAKGIESYQRATSIIPINRVLQTADEAKILNEEILKEIEEENAWRREQNEKAGKKKQLPLLEYTDDDKYYGLYGNKENPGLQEDGYKLTYDAHGQQVLAKFDKSSNYYIPTISNSVTVKEDGRTIPSRYVKLDGINDDQKHLFVASDVGAERLDEIRQKRRKLFAEASNLNKVRRFIWNESKVNPEAPMSRTVEIDKDVREYLNLGDKKYTYSQFLEKVIDTSRYKNKEHVNQFLNKDVLERAREYGFVVDQRDKSRTALNFLKALHQETDSRAEMIVRSNKVSYDENGEPYYETRKAISLMRELDIEKKELEAQKDSMVEERLNYKRGVGNDDLRYINAQEAAGMLQEKATSMPYMSADDGDWMTGEIMKSMLGIDLNEGDKKFVQVTDSNGKSSWTLMPDMDKIIQIRDELMKDPAKKKEIMERLPEARPMDMTRYLLSAALTQSDIKIGQLDKDGNVIMTKPKVDEKPEIYELTDRESYDNPNLEEAWNKAKKQVKDAKIHEQLHKDKVWEQAKSITKEEYVIESAIGKDGNKYIRRRKIEKEVQLKPDPMKVNKDWTDYSVEIAGREKPINIREYRADYIQKALAGDISTNEKEWYVKQLNLVQDKVDKGSYYRRKGDIVPFKLGKIREEDGIVEGYRKHTLIDNIASVTTNEQHVKTASDRAKDYMDKVHDWVYAGPQDYFDKKASEINSQAINQGKVRIILTDDIRKAWKRDSAVMEYDNVRQAYEDVWEKLSQPEWKSGRTDTGLVNFGDSNVKLPKALVSKIYNHSATVAHQLEGNPDMIGSLSYTAFANAMQEQSGKKGTLALDLTATSVSKEAKLAKVASDDFAGLMTSAMHGGFLRELIQMNMAEESRTGEKGMRFQHIIKTSADMYMDEKGKRMKYEDLSGAVHEMLVKSGVGETLEARYVQNSGLADLKQSDVQKILRNIDSEQSMNNSSYDEMARLRMLFEDATDMDGMEDYFGERGDGLDDIKDVDERKEELMKAMRGDESVQIAGKEVYGDEVLDALSKEGDLDFKELLGTGKYTSNLKKRSMDSVGAASTGYDEFMHRLMQHALANRLVESEAIDEKGIKSMRNQIESGTNPFNKTFFMEHSQHMHRDKLFDVFKGFANEYGTDTLYGAIDHDLGEFLYQYSGSARKAIQHKENPTTGDLRNLMELKKHNPNMNVQGVTKDGRGFTVKYGEGYSDEPELLMQYSDTGETELLTDRSSEAKADLQIRGIKYDQFVDINEKPVVERKERWAGTKSGVVHVPSVNYDNTSKVKKDSYMEHSPAESYTGVKEIRQGAKGIVVDFETMMLPDQVKDLSRDTWIMEATLQDVQYDKNGLRTDAVTHYIVKPTKEVRQNIERLTGLDLHAQDFKPSSDINEVKKQLKTIFDKPDMSAMRNIAKYTSHERKDLWADYDNDIMARDIADGLVTVDEILTGLQKDTIESFKMFKNGNITQWRERLGIDPEHKVKIVKAEDFVNEMEQRLVGDNSWVIGQNVVGAEQRMLNQQRHAVQAPKILESSHRDIVDTVNNHHFTALDRIDVLDAMIRGRFAQEIKRAEMEDLEKTDILKVNRDNTGRVTSVNFQNPEISSMMNELEDEAHTNAGASAYVDDLYRMADEFGKNGNTIIYGNSIFDSTIQGKMEGIEKYWHKLSKPIEQILTDTDDEKSIELSKNLVRQMGFGEQVKRDRVQLRNNLKELGGHRPAHLDKLMERIGDTGSWKVNNAERLGKVIQPAIEKEKNLYGTTNILDSFNALKSSIEGYDKATKGLQRPPMSAVPVWDKTLNKMRAYIDFNKGASQSYKDMMDNDFYIDQVESEKMFEKSRAEVIEEMQNRMMDDKDRAAKKKQQHFLKTMHNDATFDEMYKDAVWGSFQNKVTKADQSGEILDATKVRQMFEETLKQPTVTVDWMKKHDLIDDFDSNDTKRRTVANALDIMRSNVPHDVNSMGEDFFNSLDTIQKEQLGRFDDFVKNNPADFKAIEMMHLAKHLYPELQEKGRGFNMGSLINNVMANKNPEAVDIYKTGKHTAYHDTLAETLTFETMVNDMGENIPEVKHYQVGDLVTRVSSHKDAGERGTYQIVKFNNKINNSLDNPGVTMVRLHDGNTHDFTNYTEDGINGFIKANEDDIVRVEGYSPENLRWKFEENFIPATDKDIERLAWDDAREDIQSAQKNFHSMRSKRLQVQEVEGALRNFYGTDKSMDELFNAKNILEMQMAKGGQIDNQSYLKSAQRFDELYNQMKTFDDELDAVSPEFENALERYEVAKQKGFKQVPRHDPQTGRAYTPKQRRAIFQDMLDNGDVASAEKQEFDALNARMKKATQGKKMFFDGLDNYERELIMNPDYFAPDKRTSNSTFEFNPRQAMSLEMARPYFNSAQAAVQEKALAQIEDLRTTGLATDSQAAAITEEINKGIYAKAKARKEERIKTKQLDNTLNLTLDSSFMNLADSNVTIRTNSVSQITQGLESTLGRMIKSDVGDKVRNQLKTEGLQPTEVNQKSRIINDYLIPFLSNSEDVNIGKIGFKSGMEGSSLKIDHLAQKIYEAGPHTAEVEDITQPLTDTVYKMDDITPMSQLEDEFIQDMQSVRTSEMNKFLDEAYQKSSLPIYEGKSVDLDTTKIIHSASQMYAFESLTQQRAQLKREGHIQLPGMKLNPLVTEFESNVLGIKPSDVANGLFENTSYSGFSGNDLSELRNSISQILESFEERAFKNKQDAIQQIEPILAKSNSSMVDERVREMMDSYYEKARNKRDMRKALQQEMASSWRETYDRINRLTPKDVNISSIEDLVDFHTEFDNSEALDYMRQLNWVDDDNNITPFRDRIFPMGGHQKAGKSMVEISSFSDNSQDYYGKHPVLMDMINEYGRTPMHDVDIESIEPTDYKLSNFNVSNVDDFEEVNIPNSGGGGGDDIELPQNSSGGMDDSAPRAGINRHLDTIKEIATHKYTKLGVGGALGAMMLYNMAQQPDILEPPKQETPSEKYDRVPLESKQNDARYMNQGGSHPTMPTHKGQGQKMHPKGYDVKVSGQSNGRIDGQGFAGNLDKAMGSRNDGRVTVNTSDNSANIDRSWLEDRVDDLIRDGYTGG